MNEKDERTRFLQVWMTPDKRGHKPQYGSSQYSSTDRHNKLLHILGGTGSMPNWETASSKASIQLHQVCLHTKTSICRSLIATCITLGMQHDMMVQVFDSYVHESVLMGCSGNHCHGKVKAGPLYGMNVCNACCTNLESLPCGCHTTDTV